MILLEWPVHIFTTVFTVPTPSINIYYPFTPQVDNYYLCTLKPDRRVNWKVIPGWNYVERAKDRATLIRLVGNNEPTCLTFDLGEVAVWSVTIEEFSS